MDPATLIMLSKIVSDLIIVVTMGIQKVDGMKEEDKKEMLASLQAQTTKLMSDLMTIAVK
jgi:hypothetical protein